MGIPYFDEDSGQWLGGDEDDAPAAVVQVRPRPAAVSQAAVPPVQTEQEIQDAELEAVDARLAEVAYYRAFLNNPSLFGEVVPAEAEIVRRVETGFKRFAKQKIAEVMGGTPVSIGGGPALFTAEQAVALRRLADAFPGELEVTALQKFAAASLGSKILTAAKPAVVRATPIVVNRPGVKAAAPPPAAEAPPPARRPPERPPAAPQAPQAAPQGGRRRKPPGALPMPKGQALSMALQAQVSEKIEEAAASNGGVSGEAAVTQMLLGAIGQTLSGAR